MTAQISSRREGRHRSSSSSGNNNKSGNGNDGPLEEIKDLMAQRRTELNAEKSKLEKQFINGRWVTDVDALHNKETHRREKLNRVAPRRTAQVSLFTLPENANTGLELEEREVADRVTQEDIVQSVDVQTQHKKFDLVLNKLGPYTIDFTTNGTHLLLAGLRGHMANIKWSSFELNGEVQLKDKVNDAIFLVDHTMTAVAQKKYVYMYTKEGTEMHILSKLAHMDILGYLPKHLLLVAASSRYSVMQYLDVSTGVELGTKAPAIMRDPATCLAVNPINATVATGDVRGVVKFWSPNVVDPLLQLKAHRGVIDSVCVHPNGRFFITLGGADHKMKVWDCRTLRALEEYALTYTVNSLHISSKGLVALGGGTHVQIWREMFTSHKPNAPYMKFNLGYGNVAHKVQFCPFEDVLGVGHANGFTSLLIPGAGEANPDFYYANPHETERHRKERVVSQLLDKLPPDTISMDIQVPGVNETRLAEYNENLRLNRRARMIREKKQRKADKSLGDRAPTGLLGAGQVDHDDELDEEIGFKEKPHTTLLKSKQEKLAERKAAKWDKKDSGDKVRSKQTMRHSRLVQRLRARKLHEEQHGKYDQDDLNSEEEEALELEKVQVEQRRKRQRREAMAFAEDVRGGAISDIASAPTVMMTRHKTKNNASNERSEESVRSKDKSLYTNAAFRRFL